MVAATAAGQTMNFDARPTGFLRADTGGMPPGAWNGTTLGTAKDEAARLYAIEIAIAHGL
jgi:hypothetical protein